METNKKYKFPKVGIKEVKISKKQEKTTISKKVGGSLPPDDDE